jgi:hypothetical protein
MNDDTNIKQYAIGAYDFPWSVFTM